jgi:hypothetical protein
MDTLLKQLQDNFNNSDRAITNYRDTWDDKEALLNNFLNDNITNDTKSNVLDPRLSTIVLERAARVMGQLPNGKCLAVSKDDEGKNKLMNLCLEKYILPNANSQFDFLTKARLLDLYSLVYGVFFGLVDWRVDEKRDYIGPDLWLLPIRDVFPQPGAVSLNDSDWIQVSTWHSYEYVKNLGKDWKNLDEIVKVLKDKGGKSRDSLSTERRTKLENELSTDIPANMVEFRTEYRKFGGKKDLGQWITYAPDFEVIVREKDNPHEDGDLPIISKHAFPLMDSIYGMGEFERGMTLQKAVNSLINLYLDGVKMSLFPPIMVNKDQVVPSSIMFQPAAKWLVNRPDAIKQLDLNPQGLSTFQSTYSFLISAMLNQAGTTDTTVNTTSDPSLGRTPQALKMLDQRESSRDNWDRFQMEKTIESIIGKFVNLTSLKQEKPITLRLFAAEIEEISKTYPDVLDMYEGGERGELSIDAGEFGGTKFDYQMVSGSTVVADKEKEVANMNTLLGMFMQAPQLIEAMHKDGKDVNFAELVTRLVTASGVQDWEKIIVDYSPAEDPMVQQQMMQQQQQAQQYQDPDIQAAAQQILGNISEIPAQPGGMNGY